MAKYFENSHSGCSVKNKPERSQKQFGKAGHLAIAKVQVREDGLNEPGEKCIDLENVHLKDKIKRVWS